MHTFSLPDKLARAVVIRYVFTNVYEYNVSSNVSYNVLPRAGIISQRWKHTGNTNPTHSLLASNTYMRNITSNCASGTMSAVSI